MSFKKPSLPELEKNVPQPNKGPRKIQHTPLTPTGNVKIGSASNLRPDKKKRNQNLGICYSEKDCKGDVLFQKVTKAKCKSAGGKSWKGNRGCESF